MTPYIPFDAWWCCLNPREQNTLLALRLAWTVNPTYIGRATYDAIVTSTGENSCILMHDNFRHVYGLHYELIPCGEDCFIDAVIFEEPFWSLLYAFSLTDGFICVTPCKLLTFPQ